MKKALISGITGQDGSYLSELLISKGYEVHGLYRRSSSNPFKRIQDLVDSQKIYLHSGDLADSLSINNIVKDVMPDEIYNLAAQSDVPTSFSMPNYTANINALGTLNFLEVIRNLNKDIKFYQASTSELYGKVREIPQTELTPFHPRSPYGVAKMYAYWICINYREAYEIFACNGILFNHESPRRGENFVTKKICNQISKIFYGSQDFLYLGNLNAKRDWGHAKDYVYMQWKMLQQKNPTDYVIASGEQHTVRRFVELACKFIGWNIKWHGSGLEEYGYIEANDKKKVIVKINKNLCRPSEVESLLGDASKAEVELGWQRTYSFEDLVNDMMQFEMENNKND